MRAWIAAVALSLLLVALVGPLGLIAMVALGLTVEGAKRLYRRLRPLEAPISDEELARRY